MSINTIRDNFSTAASLLNEFIADNRNFEKIEQAGLLMSETIKNGGKILTCGNGGSMSDAMHFAEELTGRFRENRKGMAAVAMSDPTHITCVGNDFGFDYIFSRYLEAVGNKGDVLLAISTSGNSANVLNALKAAQLMGIKVVALTGKSGGEIGQLADIEIRVPYNGYSDRIQEIHIQVIHSLIHFIEIEILL